jgi:hypothetical protein
MGVDGIHPGIHNTLMFGVSVARCASAPAEGAMSVTLAHCCEVIATRRILQAETADVLSHWLI